MVISPQYFFMFMQRIKLTDCLHSEQRTACIIIPPISQAWAAPIFLISLKDSNDEKISILRV